MNVKAQIKILNIGTLAFDISGEYGGQRRYSEKLASFFPFSDDRSNPRDRAGKEGGGAKKCEHR